MNNNFLKYLLGLLIFAFTSNMYSQSKDLEDIFALSLEELMDIKIATASKHYEKVADIPASIILVERDEIEAYGYKTIEDIIKNVAGFYLLNDYFWLGSVNFGIRGFFSTGTFNDVIVMVNGVNQVGDSYSDYPFSKINVPIEAIDRIEIVRGPMSVIYGSGAFMGAINIITNNSNENSSDLISVSVGSNNSQKIAAKVSGSEGDFQYTFNGGISSSDGLDVPFNDLTSDTDFLENVGLEATSTTDKMLKDNRIYFGFSSKFKGLTLDFEFNETQKGVFDGIPSINDGTILNMSTTNISFKYDKEITHELNLSAKAGFFFHNYFWNYELLYENAYATNNNNTSSREFDVNIFYKKESFNLLAGINYRKIAEYSKTYDYPIYGDKYSNTKITIPGSDVSWYAFYSQANIKLLKDLQLTLGIRFEKLSKYDIFHSYGNGTDAESKIEGVYDEDKIKVIPRIALIYKISDHNIIKVLYGEAVKQPSVNQNIAQLFSGQAQLVPAKINTFELNYIYSYSTALALNVSLFRNNISDLIIKRNFYNREAKQWTLHSTNEGEMSTNGLEIGIKSILHKNLNLEISGIYQKSESKVQDLENIELGYSPDLLVYLKTAYKFYSNSTVALLARYIDEVESAWDESYSDPRKGDFSSVGRIGERVESFFVVDLNIRTEQILGSGFFANLNISNIFNQEIRFPTTYSNNWADKGTLGFGRTFLLSVGYKF